MSLMYQPPLVILARWIDITNAALNQEVRLDPAAGQGELVVGEHVAEVSHVEVRVGGTASPIVPAAVEDVRLRLDGQTGYTHMKLSARNDATTAPPMGRLNPNSQTFYTYGLPIVNTPMLRGTSHRDPRLCTLPKYHRTIGLQYIARAAIAVTVIREFIVWGYLYRADEVATQVGTVGGAFSLTEPVTGKKLTVNYPIKIASADRWTQLPGGQDQGQPAIHRYVRDTINANATTPSQLYQFRLLGNNVTFDDRELYWEFQQENKCLVLTHVGVRATDANLSFALLRLGDQEFPPRRGAAGNLRGWHTRRENNPQFHYGHEFPEYPQNGSSFYALPRLPKAFIIYRQIGQFNVADNGAAVGANGVRVAVGGYLIDGV